MGMAAPAGLGQLRSAGRAQRLSHPATCTTCNATDRGANALTHVGVPHLQVGCLRCATSSTAMDPLVIRELVQVAVRARQQMYRGDGGTLPPLALLAPAGAVLVRELCEVCPEWMGVCIREPR